MVPIPNSYRPPESSSTVVAAKAVVTGGLDQVATPEMMRLLVVIEETNAEPAKVSIADSPTHIAYVSTSSKSRINGSYSRSGIPDMTVANPALMRDARTSLAELRSLHHCYTQLDLVVLSFLASL